jgi:hypothetical protein
MEDIFEKLINILCILIGFSLSLIGQDISTRKKNRKYLAKNITKFTKSIMIIKNTFSSLLNFMKININNLEEYEIDELMENICHFVKESTLLWPEFRTILYLYLPQIAKNRKIKNFEKIMEYISYEYNGSKLDKFIKPTKEMILNRQKSLLNNQEEYLLANTFIDFIEKKFISFLKKYS